MWPQNPRDFLGGLSGPPDPRIFLAGVLRVPLQKIPRLRASPAVAGPEILGSKSIKKVLFFIGDFPELEDVRDIFKKRTPVALGSEIIDVD